MHRTKRGKIRTLESLENQRFCLSGRDGRHGDLMWAGDVYESVTRKYVAR